MMHIRLNPNDPAPNTEIEDRIDAIADSNAAHLEAIREAYDTARYALASIHAAMCANGTDSKLIDRMEADQDDFDCFMEDVLSSARAAADPARIAEELDY